MSRSIYLFLNYPFIGKLEMFPFSMRFSLGIFGFLKKILSLNYFLSHL